ncbi:MULTISPECIES: hypothetical protein [Proteiniphilum]|nr:MULTISPECIES: hypothetical protein [Proteiniphilum]ULB36138.1 hypothetical protein KDN43_12035 [Proteiniphilum propionicum]
MEAHKLYVRVGTTYYKEVHKPLLSGEMTKVRVPWGAIPENPLSLIC